MSRGMLAQSIGKYQIIDLIGSGGLAQIYRAVSADRDPPGIVALKCLRSEWQSRLDVVEMFTTEADLGRTLVHRNIVRFFDSGFDARGQLFIVMEYVAGPTLADVLKNLKADERLPQELAMHVVVSVLAALHHAHEAKSPTGKRLSLIHRDISPENVLLSFDGEVKLADFGVAHLGLEGEQGKRDGVGKLPYMAPEQITRGDIDRRVDVYAMGVVLYELLTGRHPFVDGRHDSDEALAERILKGKYVRPTKHVPELPKGTDDLVQRALATRRSDRFETALEMMRALLPLYRASADWAGVLTSMLRLRFAVDYVNYRHDQREYA